MGNMSLSIAPTPTLTGKDAERFLRMVKEQEHIPAYLVPTPKLNLALKEIMDKPNQDYDMEICGLCDGTGKVMSCPYNELSRSVDCPICKDSPRPGYYIVIPKPDALSEGLLEHQESCISHIKIEEYFGNVGDKQLRKDLKEAGYIAKPDFKVRWGNSGGRDFRPDEING